MAMSVERASLPWSAGERESFFAAVARHRRAAWQVTAACSMAALMLALVAAVLMAPLFYGAIGLAFDAANLARPVPDLLGALGRLLEPLLPGRTISSERVAAIVLLAALPGLLLTACAVLSLRRTVRNALPFDADGERLRAPDRRVPTEQRLHNVVEEMALAASVRPPRVLIVPDGANAAALGEDEAHTTILFGAALLERLTRAQLQGVAAHLIASIAEGDVRIGRQAGTMLALFGVLAGLSTAFGERRVFSHARGLLRALARPASSHAIAALHAAMDPFAAPAAANAHRPAPDRLNWRDWAAMPLAGPVVLTGFLCGLVSSFLLGPLVALAWRRRKYMADATAVRLAREPDALASALVAVGGARAGIAPWFAHLAFVDGAARSGTLLQGQVLSIFPSPRRRVKALAALGAWTAPPAERTQLPPARQALVLALGAIAALLMAAVTVLLVFAAAGVSMILTVLPVSLLHALLRTLGHA